MRGFNERPPRKPFINPLLMFLYPDVFILLILNGTYYAVISGVTASLSVIFEDVYPYLTQTDVGLCFMAQGGGLLIGSWLSGKLTDSYYRKVRDDLIRQARSSTEKDIDAKAIEKDPKFPIEKARLQVLPCVMLVYTACVVGYGWALQSRVTIAVPLILQFISGFIFRTLLHRMRLTTSLAVGLIAVIILNTNQTLLIDLVPDQGSSITACVCTHLPTRLNYIKISIANRTISSVALWARAWCLLSTRSLSRSIMDGRTPFSAVSAF